MRVKAVCSKCNYQNGDYRILNWKPFNTEGLLCRNGKDGFTFSTIGNDNWADIGKEYELEIELVKADPKWGGTYVIKSVPSMLEQDIANMSREEKFNILMGCTSSARIANNILDAYPDYIEKILNEGKESIDLKKIKGVGEAYHNSYSRQLLDKYKYFNIFNKFADWGIDMIDARKISGTFGTEEQIIEAFAEDPYNVLISICGKTFLNVDKKILEKAPEFKETETRCSYLMLEILEKNEIESGSTRLDGNDLYYYIQNELKVYPELLPLIVPTAQHSPLIYLDVSTQDLAINSTYMGECNIKNFIEQKLQNSHKLDIDWTKYITSDNGITLSDEQANALKMFCEKDFMLLTGGAGMGKTQSLRAVLDLCDDNGLSYAMFAFTGAASLRMTEATGRPASTIHRPYFQEREFHEDVIIVDEFSMIDVEVCNMLISMIKNEDAKIIFVGDNAQLLPVGCGNVFNDIINSGTVPNNKLTKVFRYDTDGGLFVATNIRQGRDFFDDPMVKHEGNIYRVCNNWRFYECEEDRIFDTLIDVYNSFLNGKITPNHTKAKPSEILCLSPQNIGEIGTYRLNNEIQNIVNPIKPNQTCLTRKIGNVTINFRVGDKVINKKNDYKALSVESYQMIEESGGLLSVDDVPPSTVFNGEIGYIRELNEKNCTIQFGEQMLVFDKNKMAHDVLLGYCITDHAAQGCSSKYVVEVSSEKHTRMHSRNIFYVGGTRATDLHVEVGSVEAFKRGIAIDGNKQRDTFLKELLAS